MALYRWSLGHVPSGCGKHSSTTSIKPACSRCAFKTPLAGHGRPTLPIASPIIRQTFLKPWSSLRYPSGLSTHFTVIMHVSRDIGGGGGCNSRILEDSAPLCDNFSGPNPKTNVDLSQEKNCQPPGLNTSTYCHSLFPQAGPSHPVSCSCRSGPSAWASRRFPD
jgi:hypothetical protein